MWRIAAAVLVLVQGWITAAPLAECRGVGMSAHVESAEAHGHFTHDDSSCAACTVLALHAILPGAESPVPAPRYTEARRAPVAQSADGRPSPTRRSRAPPVAG